MKKIYLMLLLTFAICVQVVAQNRTVSGSVTDANTGEPLVGVNVVIDGTVKGTVTDFDGNFTLIMPGTNNVLRFTYVGYKETTETLSPGQARVDVTMMEDAEQLGEVIITALGIARETKALGYAAEEVDGEELVKSGEVNALQGLAGKAAGVQVIGSGGTPGASSKVVIRGNATFTGPNQPLVVVDGVPIDNSTSQTSAGDNPFNAGLSGVNSSNRGIDINPEDIASMTVLKGPAAAALYGVRAGSGAIIITTKRGEAGKMKVDFSSSVDIAQVNKLPDLQNRYAQGNGGGQIGQAEGEYDTFGLNGSGGTSAIWGPENATLGITPTDNMEEFFQTGVTYNNNLSISGGNQKSSFRLSLGALNQEGVIPNTNFDRYSVRMTGETQLTDKLTLFGTMNYINSGGIRAQNGSNLSGVMLGLTRAPSSFNLAGGTGENGYTNADGTQHQYFFPYDNPYWTAFENPFEDEVNRVLGNFSLSYDPIDWLNITYRVGSDIYTDQRKQIFAIGSYDPPQPTGQIEENILRSQEVYADLLVSANRSFGDKFNASVTLGNNLFQESFQDLYSRGRTLAIPNFYNLSNASDLYTSEYNEIIRTAALFADINLEYNRMLYLNLAGRNEWSSTFGPNQNNFFYPSASLSFVFSELIPENKIFSFGKLRYGYAQVGITPPVYSSTTYFNSPILTDGFTDGLSFPFLGQNGFGNGDILGNPDLAPERLSGHEIGLDLRFFEGRLTADVTYYNQVSDDILLLQPLAGSTGFLSARVNTGSMVNRGIELLVGATPVKTTDFIWNIDLNFTSNYNEVLETAPGVDELNVEAGFASMSGFAIKGLPYGALYGTAWERTDDGDLIIGANGLPIVAANRQSIGNPFPLWTAGLRNTFSFKGVELTALLDIRKGGDVWCGTCARLNRLGATEASAENRGGTYVIEGVKLADDGETYVANDVPISAIQYYQNFVGDAGAAVEQAIFDGSWLRLRELGLRYRFDLRNKVDFLEGIELSITGRNIWLRTDYPGVDPETSLTGAGSNLSGFDYFNNPGTRSFVFGFKANL